MSPNLPANRLLKRTKGNWSAVQYPVTAVAQAMLAPADFFEPVDVGDARSCIPVGGKRFYLSLDADSGRVTLHGETMVPPLSIRFHCDEAWEVVFAGRCMQITASVTAESQIDSLLAAAEYTLPSLLSVGSGLAIHCETVEVALGDAVEARAEIVWPPQRFKLVEPDERVSEMKSAIEMVSISRSSGRFTLAASYLREALFYDASYLVHNPYTHSLLVILKCAQAIEVLFGSNRDSIRHRCRSLGIDDTTVETDIIPITLARNELGPAHASSFVPTPREADILRSFASRSVGTLRQLLLHIARAPAADQLFLTSKLKRNPAKTMLLGKLEDTLKAPAWCERRGLKTRPVVMRDARL